MGVGPNYQRSKPSGSSLRSFHKVSSSSLPKPSSSSLSPPAVTLPGTAITFKTQAELDAYVASKGTKPTFTVVPASKVKVAKTAPPMAPNPDPAKYTILRSQQIGNWLVVEMMYEGCTNFEGKKTLVFKGVTLGDLKAQKLIDPHFSDNPHYFHPIARFIPTADGWRMALGLAKSEKARLDAKAK